MKKIKFLFVFAFLANLITGNLAFGQIPFAAAPVATPVNCVDGGTAVTTTNCPQGTFSASFIGGTVFTNAGDNGLAAGSVWRYNSVANVAGDIINATVTIDAAYHAVLAELDKDNAPDENGNSTLQSFFAPRIDPDQSLGSTNRNGYIQFTIRFWKNGWIIPALLDGINYSHYDIDGVNGNLGYWFRETGAVKEPTGNLQISVNNNTELIPYNYLNGADSWKGYAGTTCNRSNFSRYAEVAASFKFPVQQSFLTIRMGYDYQDLPASGTYGNQDPRLYVSKFECFRFPQPIILPVKLLSFTGSFKNNTTSLNWITEKQEDLSSYEIERSIDGTNFSAIGSRQALGTTASTNSYQYIDDLSFMDSQVFFYRLKMIDLTGEYKYSNVILIRKDQKTMTDISITPNPIIKGAATTLRFASQSKTVATIKIIDMAGSVVYKQQNNITEGTNSISLNNLDRIHPGVYILKISNGNEVLSTKFIISQ